MYFNDRLLYTSAIQESITASHSFHLASFVSLSAFILFHSSAKVKRFSLRRFSTGQGANLDAISSCLIARPTNDAKSRGILPLICLFRGPATANSSWPHCGIARLSVSQSCGTAVRRRKEPGQDTEAEILSRFAHWGCPDLTDSGLGVKNPRSPHENTNQQTSS